MQESYRPTRRSREWVFGADGISVTMAGRRLVVPWNDLERLDADGCTVTLHLPNSRRSITLGEHWSGSMPSSGFIAAARSHLPERLLSDKVNEALRCAWGWSRAVELGRAERCLQCGSALQRDTVSELRGSFGAVEAVLHEVDRRVCEHCEAAFPVDEDRMSDLLFDVSEQWERRVLDWSNGAAAALRKPGFLRRRRGSIRVRATGSNTARPAPGDVHLAVLHALCGEVPPG